MNKSTISSHHSNIINQKKPQKPPLILKKLNLYKKRTYQKIKNPYLIIANNSHNSKQRNKYKHLSTITPSKKGKLTKLIINSSNNSVKRNDIINLTQPTKSFNTNNFINTTLNFAGKNFINVIKKNNLKIMNNKKEKNNVLNKKLSKYIKEKEESKNLFNKQEKLIKHLIEENKNLDQKIIKIENENKILSHKIKDSKRNQEQLVLLVKVIEKNGIDIENIIDMWNNKIQKSNYNKNGTYSNDTVDSLNEDDIMSSNSFIPIIDQKNIKEKGKIIVNNVPKLNFSTIKRNGINGKK